MVEELNKRPKVTVKGLIWLWGITLLAGIVIGGLTSIIGSFIYLILLFPIGMGLASVFITKSVVISEKIRSPFIVVITGLFATVLIYGSMHFFDYLQFRNALAKEVQAQVLAEYGEASEPCADVLAIDLALEMLAVEDPRKARVVELRFFGGLSIDESAEALGVSARTVHADWSFARAWLYRTLTAVHAH